MGVKVRTCRQNQEELHTASACDDNIVGKFITNIASYDSDTNQEDEDVHGFIA
jgi:hypothetical protein